MQEPREFRRAYKACLNCRKRKSKCDINPETYSAGRSCARCRREMRQCVFAMDRPTAKRRRRTTDEPTAADAAHESPSNDGSFDISGTSDHQSPVLSFSPGSTQGINGRSGPNEPSLLQSKNSGHRPVDERRENAITSQVNGLADSVMRSVVSNGSDALNLLFEAARHQGRDRSADAAEHRDMQSIDDSTVNLPSNREINATPQPDMSLSTRSWSSHRRQVPNASSDVLSLWNACRFVKMGWFSADEAVLYLDLLSYMFYRNMAPLSPILTDFYSNHANHYHLIAQEPMLCCTILAISSRYHVLPGMGGASRGYLIHERLWDHCQHLLMRIMLGQEKSSKAKTRTPGTIEALLLLTEWHPRALHFPPPNDGWDSDLILSAVDERDEPRLAVDTPTQGRWLEDVINPARRSDRMSWMLVGCALTLAYELGVFDEADGMDKTPRPVPLFNQERRVEQRFRFRRLLFVCIEQLSLRLGCRSITPHSLTHAITERPSVAVVSPWQAFIDGWIDLTKLVKSVSDTVFPSQSITTQLLRSGRYVNLIEHFQPLLSAWKEKNLDVSKLGNNFYNILYMEYHNARIYTNSPGLQAVVENTVAQTSQQSSPRNNPQMAVDSTDYSFIQNVVDGSLKILETAIKLAEAGTLAYSPVRVFLRITTASVFLLKGLSLGVGANKLRTSLDTLNRSIAALKTSSTLDDMHLGARYAKLLEMHVCRLQKSFTACTRPSTFATRPPSVEHERTTITGVNGSTSSSAMTGDLGFERDSLGTGQADLTEDWLTLHFDPSLVAFGPGDTQGFSWLGDGALDFIWNLES